MSDTRWSAIPAARSKAPILQIRLFAVVGVLILSALMGIFSTLAWISNASNPVPTPAPVAQAAGFAESIAQDYLAGRTTTLPVASDLSPDFASQYTSSDRLKVVSLSRQGFTSVSDNLGVIETTYFLAVTTQGTYRLAVPVRLTTKGPVLATYPTLLPARYKASTGPLDFSNNPYPNDPYYITPTTIQTATPNVATSISTWATALAANDTQALYQIVNDPNPSAQPGDYVGLGGFTLRTKPQILGGYQVPGSELYVRVRLVMSSSSAKGVILSNDYDLEIANPKSPNPAVVAWGPAGSSKNLVAYQTNNIRHNPLGG